MRMCISVYAQHLPPPVEQASVVLGRGAHLCMCTHMRMHMYMPTGALDGPSAQSSAAGQAPCVHTCL